MRKILIALIMLFSISLSSQPIRPTRPTLPPIPNPVFKNSVLKKDFTYYNRCVSILYFEVISKKELSKKNSVVVGDTTMALSNSIKGKISNDRNLKKKQLLAAIDSLKIEAEKL